MIHVIATIKTQPGKREKFLARFRELVPPVLAEEGCVAYGPTINAETGIGQQTRLDDDTVVVVEQWKSVAHLEAHLAAPHMKAFGEETGHLRVSVELVITESI